MDELVKNSGFEKMISDIETLVNASKNELATSINKVMTVTYWSIGKYIVEFPSVRFNPPPFRRSSFSGISLQ